MCGINGIFGIENSQRLKEGIELMNQCLKHRGPDDTGIFQDRKLGLGHQRLSILDLSEAGHQPMKSFDNRYVIVYNGEIYNYREIKNELDEYNYASHTDTEVILAAYMKWGKNCVQKFNGMFAFAIWDTEKRELFIARDRLGIKPLYFYQGESQFVFSSEIRSLLKSGYVPKKIDQARLNEYLKYQTVHAPGTIVRDVKMLMPGHHITVNDSEIEIKKYWEIDKYIAAQNETKDYSRIKSRVRQLLFESVEKRLIADVPIGAFLSGGIDSSAIVGLMSEITPGNVKTFSVTFDESKFSEAHYSRVVAKKFNTDHTEIRLKPDDFLNLLPDALDAMDHPSGDGPNTYVVSKVTREAGVTVALSGLGGDELFAGYQIFSRSVKLQKYEWLLQLPRGLRKLFSSIIRYAGNTTSAEKIAKLIAAPNFELINSYPVSRQVYSDSDVSKLLNTNGIAESNRVSEIVSRLGSIKDSECILSNVSVSEIETYMQNVLLRDTDQMSMASALEVRVPFLDHKLVEYVLSLSDQVKYPISPKKLLVDSLNPMLPDEIVNRKKMGFTFPWDVWMKKELRKQTVLSLESLAEREFFDADAVMNMWNKFLNNDQRINWARIWILVVLEKWMNKNEIT